MLLKFGFVSPGNQCTYDIFSISIFPNTSRIPKGPLVPVWKYKVDLKWMQIEYLFSFNTINISGVAHSVNKERVPDILFPKGLIFVIRS